MGLDEVSKIKKITEVGSARPLFMELIRRLGDWKEWVQWFWGAEIYNF